MNQKTDGLLAMLGARLKQARLNADLSQMELADIIGMSRTAIEGAERGKCTLNTLVKILHALRMTDQIDAFLPEQQPSPVLMAKAKGKVRQRASGSRKARKAHDVKGDIGW